MTGSLHTGRMRRHRTSILFVVFALALAAADPAVELEAAIRRETVQGDLKGAAEAYRKLAAMAGVDREVAARALFRLALVYRKQGDAQARQTLDRVVREFGDQRRTVAEARAELARLTPLTGKTALSIRQVWKGATLHVGDISADGTMAAVVEARTANVGVLNLRTGETRILTQYGNYNRLNGVASQVHISPDGKLLAFYAGLHDGVGEVRVIRTDGTQPRTLYRGPREERVAPLAWTPDSQSILGGRIVKQVDGKWRTDLVLMAAASGDVRVLKSDIGPSRADIRAVISPDGRWLAYAEGAAGIPLRIVGMNAPEAVRFESMVRSDHPIGWTPDSKKLLFASNRSGGPGIWQQSVSDGGVGGPAELIRSFPNWPQGLGLDAKGTLYYREFSAQIDAYTMPLADGAVPTRVTRNVEGSTAGPMWSPDERRLGWFTMDRGEVREFHVRDLASGAEKSVIMQLKVHKSFQSHWLSNGKILLRIPGRSIFTGSGSQESIHLMDPATGAAEPIAHGGQAYSADGGKVYQLDGPKVREVDIATGRKREVYHDPLASYVRDPVLSPDGRHLALVAHQAAAKDKPDYYGAVHIKIVDLATGTGRELVKVRPSWFRRMMAWTPDAKNLIYATEWYAGVDQPARLWIVPASGGTPKQLGRDFEGRVFGLTVSPDGRLLGFDEEKGYSELMAMEGLFGR
jgi:Tol biopolymer transport system component